MNLSGSRSRIDASARDLNRQWQRARESWRDEKAHEFGHQYIDEILSTVSTVLPVLDDLDKFLAKVRQACE